MPEQTQQAIKWALQQTWADAFGQIHQVSSDNAQHLTDKVRDYFNTNNIVYDTFSYDDLIPYLSLSE